jgi:hypothetical protein
MRSKEYINLCRDQVLAQKRMMGCYLNGYASGIGEATFGGGMGAFGGGMGGAPFGGGIGGMGSSMGGGSFSSMLAPFPPSIVVNNGASSGGGMGSYMSNEEVPEI